MKTVRTSVPAGSKKTVLAVDGDPLVRQLLVDVLADGDCYNVLTADNGARGLQRSREFKGEIDLLLTDFQMSGMSGIELATALTIDRPRLKVLLLSGFPEGLLVLNEGWHFLPKPFIASQLRALVVGLLSPDKKFRYADPTPSDQEGG